ncbi:EcsC family protein [Desulfonema magnum]|uniref:DUF697 n=1 Tax=Desulfonema magnum TaxID=45655 RepID=A0A975GNI7_9BACT|nr:EcsC family protein [Desulfonema magnum]QTA87807.1 DUF697 [Desulfonema magnum]
MKETIFLMQGKDLADLKRAKSLLEKDSIAAKTANFFGDAAETLSRLLPPAYRESAAMCNLVAIEKSWEFAMTTMSERDIPRVSEEKNILYVATAGAVGGVGILTLFAELPVTTVLMLRAVADIARDEGEDYNQFETKIASLEVFALGGEPADENIGETGYYAIRTSLEKPPEESSKHIAKKGIAGMGSPFAVQLIAQIAAKYQTIISAQIMARAIPIAGAAAGALINIIFINLFQDKARGHFIIRRLERKYGIEKVKKTYNAVRTSEHNGISMKPEFQDKGTKKAEEKVFKAEVEGILRHHVWVSMGVGLIPLPLMDFAGLTLVQLTLIRKLAKAYNIPFSKDIVKNLLSSLAGGALPVPVSVLLTAGTEKLTLTASLAKFIPGMGQTIGVVTMPILAGAATYAIGKVFIQHFASGGTFLTFDPEKVKDYYAKMFQKGKNIAADMKKRENIRTA